MTAPVKLIKMTNFFMTKTTLKYHLTVQVGRLNLRTTKRLLTMVLADKGSKWPQVARLDRAVSSVKYLDTSVACSAIACEGRIVVFVHILPWKHLRAAEASVVERNAYETIYPACPTCARWDLGQDCLQANPIPEFRVSWGCLWWWRHCVLWHYRA